MKQKQQNTQIKINESLTLSQSSKTLTFGTDAFLLSAFAGGGAKRRAAELGCGSGVISLLCGARKKFSHIYAVEIQQELAELCRQNISQNDLADIITPLCADIRDLTPALTDGELDCVFANPPYMKADSGKRNQHDEKFIARHEVFGDISDFCACAYRLLRHGGKFYTVWRPDRLADLVCALRANRLEPKKVIFVHAYPSALPSIILTEAVKGGASGNKLYPPLYLSDSMSDSTSGKLSQDAELIYSTGSFEGFLGAKK